MAAARKPFQLRKLELHTAAKHALLRKYLGAWFPIMAKYNPRVVYYDAFAGPGEYQGGEPGSPMIALETLVTHDAFAQMSRTDFRLLFNEQDAGCAEHLGRLIEDFHASHQPWPANVHVTITSATFIDQTSDMPGWRPLLHSSIPKVSRPRRWRCFTG